MHIYIKNIQNHTKKHSNFNINNLIIKPKSQRDEAISTISDMIQVQMVQMKHLK